MEKLKKCIYAIVLTLFLITGLPTTYAKNIEFDNDGFPEFDVYKKGEFLPKNRLTGYFPYAIFIKYAAQRG